MIELVLILTIALALIWWAVWTVHVFALHGQASWLEALAKPRSAAFSVAIA